MSAVPEVKRQTTELNNDWESLSDIEEIDSPGEDTPLINSRQDSSVSDPSSLHNRTSADAPQSSESVAKAASYLTDSSASPDSSKSPATHKIEEQDSQDGFQDRTIIVKHRTKNITTAGKASNQMNASAPPDSASSKSAADRKIVVEAESPVFDSICDRIQKCCSDCCFQ